MILPELWHVGAFDVDAAREHAPAARRAARAALGGLAAEHRAWLHGGSFCELADDGQHYNTSVLFAPDGELVASYRKVHLFGFDGGETVLMSGGEELVVVETPLGPTGLATCYDLRFPELFRALTDGGATAFLLTSGWPTPRIEHWDVLTRARAIENQAWFVACNEVGAQPGIELGGHSVVVDPKGAVVAQARHREEVLFVDVDPQASVRLAGGVPGARRHPTTSLLRFAARPTNHIATCGDGGLRSDDDDRLAVRVEPGAARRASALRDGDAAGRDLAVVTCRKIPPPALVSAGDDVRRTPSAPVRIGPAGGCSR